MAYLGVAATHIRSMTQFNTMDHNRVRKFSAPIRPPVKISPPPLNAKMPAEPSYFSAILDYLSDLFSNDFYGPRIKIR